MPKSDSSSKDLSKRRAGKNRDVIDAMQAHNEAAQLEHHWGVPLMVLNGEPFFGQDRIDSLTWRLDQLGLRRD